MRSTILVLTLAVFTSASPIDRVVPEESLFALDNGLDEATQTINEMTAAGKSDKDCRKLVTETRKDIQTNVDTCQKTLDAMKTGSDCQNRGQDDVKKMNDSKSKADKHVVHCHGEVTKAASASVNFGSRSFSSLTEGKCSSFYSSIAYTTAATKYKAAVTTLTRAKGAASEAATALKNAIASAAKERHECLCKVRDDANKAFALGSAADAANQKSWNFACKVECVLDHKTDCKCSAAPKCKRAKLHADVYAEAGKCGAGSAPAPAPAPVPSQPQPQPKPRVDTKEKEEKAKEKAYKGKEKAEKSKEKADKEEKKTKVTKKADETAKKAAEKKELATKANEKKEKAKEKSDKEDKKAKAAAAAKEKAEKDKKEKDTKEKSEKKKIEDEKAAKKKELADKAAARARAAQEAALKAQQRQQAAERAQKAQEVAQKRTKISGVAYASGHHARINVCGAQGPGVGTTSSGYHGPWRKGGNGCFGRTTVHLPKGVCFEAFKLYGHWGGYYNWASGWPASAGSQKNNRCGNGCSYLGGACGGAHGTTYTTPDWFCAYHFYPQAGYNC